MESGSSKGSDKDQNRTVLSEKKINQVSSEDWKNVGVRRKITDEDEHSAESEGNGAQFPPAEEEGVKIEDAPLSDGPESYDSSSDRYLLLRIRGHSTIHYDVENIAEEQLASWLAAKKGIHDAGWTLNLAHVRLWSGVMTYTPAHNDVSWKGYLIRNDQSWGWSCTLAMSYNTESRSSYSVCIGLQRDEIDVFLKHLEIGKREDFFYIQAVMKTDDYFKSGKVRGPLDLVGFSSKLTALGTSSAGVAQLCSTQDRIVRFLEDECQKMMREGTSEFLADVDEMIVFTRELLRGEQQHNEYNRAAAAAQVQMVYSLTAQRDSDQSHKLALLSQEQNNINVEISRFAAYESRLSNRMAEESLKYGVDMQVIAAVTLTFLPGTFIATLFSSSFWDFHPEPTGQVVSKWIWLYFVLTIALTLAVLAGWRVASRMKTDGLEMPPELEPGKLLKVNGRDRQAEEEGLA